jgi:uncharacterized protein (DUF849 family)
MYSTEETMLPEDMVPLVITAAPFGPQPQLLSGDAESPLTWEEQVQTAVDCYNAGATVLHVHVRDPLTGKGSTDFDQYNHFLGLLREAMPNMILQVGALLPFSPRTGEARDRWSNCDCRHMLTELDPKPECVTVPVDSTQRNVVSMMTKEVTKGTHLDDARAQAAWAGMVVDGTPAFYPEHLKRLRMNKIQPYFVPAQIQQIELIERLVRTGTYMGPLNMALVGYGGGTQGRNPQHWMELIRRTPHGAVTTFWSSMRGLISLSAMALVSATALVLGQHIRVGNEGNIWGADRKRATAVKQVEGVVSLAREFGRKVATAEEARNLMKVGVWYDSVDETLQHLGLPPNAAEDSGGQLKPDEFVNDSHPIA